MRNPAREHQPRNLGKASNHFRTAGILLACLIYIVPVSPGTAFATEPVSLPPVSTLFKVQQKGSISKIHFNIETRGYYSFLLNYYDTRELLRKSLRVLLNKDRATNIKDKINEYASAPLHLTLVKHSKNDNRTLIDQKYENHNLDSYTSEYFSQEIDRINLDAGDYTVTAESISDIPFLADIKITFQVRTAFTRK